MHRSHSAVSRQQRRIRTEVQRSDSDGFFNLLTGEDLLEDVEALLPAHRATGTQAPNQELPAAEQGEARGAGTDPAPWPPEETALR